MMCLKIYTDTEHKRDMSEISLFIVKHCYVIAASKQTIIIPKNNNMEAMAWCMNVANKQRPST